MDRPSGMHIIESKDQTFGLACAELTPERMQAATSPLAARILRLLAQQPMHASAIAAQLHEQEQKVHYHLRKLRQAGIVTLDHVKDTGGAAAKVLRLAAPAVAMRFRPMEPMAKQVQVPKAHAAFLAPFIIDGKWDACIVVGSPEPHGQEGARSRDVSFAVELGMFLGTFLSAPPDAAVTLDTELRDWSRNLIILGGPVVNKAAERVNRHSPLAYDSEMRAFRSRKTGKAHGSDNAGVIVKFPNPFSKGKWILLLAGKRYAGTRAALLAFTRRFGEVAAKGQAVVEGLDADSDGVLESVRIIE